METKRRRKGEITSDLPEECISDIILRTSPRDACRLALVSKLFNSAAKSDVVWKWFLPSDYQDIVSQSSLLPRRAKDLYFYLCHNPILVNNGTMSFSLEKESGKKCYMIRAREFAIAWGNTPDYWIWPSIPESRFGQVAELKCVWWFDIKGRVETRILSTKTKYAAYLVFKFAKSRDGFERRPVDFEVYFEGRHNGEKRRALLDPPVNTPSLCEDRGDGWMEIEMGEFFNENGDYGTVVCSVFDFDKYILKRGIIIEGIELRPKNI